MANSDGMTIINNDIKTNNFSNIYLLGGEEKYLVAQYRDKLVKALIDVTDTMNYSVFKGENARPDSIVETALTMPFFGDRRVILVEDSGFFKKGNEDIEKLLDDVPDTTIITFVEDSIDKRCRLYKQVSKLGRVAIFDTPDEKTLLVWIKSLFTKENIRIEDAAVYRLLEGVGADMNNLANEVEKLKSYCIEEGVVRTADVEKLSVNHVEGKIFDMMDALSRRDKTSTMELYDDLLSLREPAMRILYLITRQFNLLLKCKLALESGSDNSKVASVLKVPPFAVKKYVAQCKGYSYKQLLDRVAWCQEADTDIKSGRMKDNMAVDMLIMKLLQ